MRRRGKRGRREEEKEGGIKGRNAVKTQVKFTNRIIP